MDGWMIFWLLVVCVANIWGGITRNRTHVGWCLCIMALAGGMFYYSTKEYDAREHALWYTTQECVGRTATRPEIIIADSFPFVALADINASRIFVRRGYENDKDVLRHEYIHILTRRVDHPYQPFATCGGYEVNERAY